MTLEQLENMKQNFIQAIHQYRTEKDCDEVELELLIDRLLCDLPKDMVYVEWYDRSQVKNIADSQLNNEEANEDLVDTCMMELWEYNNSIMDDELVQDIVCDSIREQYYKKD